MYFIKTLGTEKVPDYIQVRDDSFALVEFIKLSYFSKRIADFCVNNIEEKLELIKNTDFGIIIKIED